MNRFMAWLTTPCPWWQFWNPQSGAEGGVLGGLVLAIVCGIVHFVRECL